MEEMITGYQWKANMGFLESYSFYNNMDQVEVHLPPRTTLKKPPNTLPGYEAAWDGKNWVVRPEIIEINTPSIPDGSTIILPSVQG